MTNQFSTTLFHLALLAIQIICLVRLTTLYTGEIEAARLSAASPSTLLRGGDVAALTLFAGHLYLWAVEANAPQEYTLPVIGVICGWTAMLAAWTKYRQKISQSKGAVK